MAPVREPEIFLTIADMHATVIAKEATEIAIQPVDLHWQCVQKMRQRQPHRADLFPAWRQAVEDAARHHEVGLGVVVAQRQACAPVDGSSEGAQNGSETAKGTRKGIEGGHRLDI